MNNPATTTAFDVNSLPPRISTAEVLEIARFGRRKLTARIRSGKFPQPVDRGKDGFIFLKKDVLEALHITTSQQSVNPFEAALD